jgi:hypothetical protein
MLALAKQLDLSSCDNQLASLDSDSISQSRRVGELLHQMGHRHCSHFIGIYCSSIKSSGMI